MNPHLQLSVAVALASSLSECEILCMVVAQPGAKNKHKKECKLCVFFFSSFFYRNSLQFHVAVLWALVHICRPLKVRYNSSNLWYWRM